MYNCTCVTSLHVLDLNYAFVSIAFVFVFCFLVKNCTRKTLYGPGKVLEFYGNPESCFGLILK